MKVEGSNITITDSVYNKMSITPLGACEQDETPTPDNPVDVKVVTGDNSVVVQNKNLVMSTLQNANISGGGYIGTSTEFDLRIARVSKNETYIVTTGASTGFIAGFFTTMPQLGSTSYNASRVVQDSLIFTAPINGYVVFRTNLGYSAPQMEKGTTQTTYVAHQEQTLPLHLGTNYLAGIGDYKDEIVGTKDDWKIKRYVGKVVFNGSEEWSNYNNTILYTRGIYPAGASVTEAINGYCNQATTDTNDYILFSNNARTAFGVKNLITYWGLSEIDTTVWKTYLSTNNVIVYYILATPTEETITDNQLITDLNNMYQAMGYDGTTNIIITSNPSNAQMTAEVTYTSESDMCEKLLFIFNKMKDKLYHIIRSL